MSLYCLYIGVDIGVDVDVGVDIGAGIGFGVVVVRIDASVVVA